jgi:hypothetical protein
MVITLIRIAEHLTAGDLTDDHVGRYIVIRPKGSEADIMGRLNRVLQFPYTHSTNLVLENAHPTQSVWAPVTASPPYALEATAPVALIAGFEE